MFYDVRSGDHGLPHDPFKAIVAPRPIGWISSADRNGVPNLAPYSFFNAVSDSPHIVMFSSDGIKDSQRNVEETGEFICNIVTYDLREKMNASSASVGQDVSEFELAGLSMEPGKLVNVCRVKETPVALECKYLNTVDLKDVDGNASRYTVVLGQVVGIHIDQSVLTEGLLDIGKLNPVCRMGYHNYSHISEVFEMRRPK